MPLPIAIPIFNLIGHNTQVFHYLQQHILGRPDHLTTRDERAEAEVMVWRELAKAASFLRELGLAAGRGDIRESGLREVAKRSGLSLVPKNSAGPGRKRVKSGCVVAMAGENLTGGARVA
jgi:hypothetical protein